MTEFVERVRQSADKKVIYSLHALNEMNSEREIITMNEVMLVIRNGEIIEDYPEDKRGHSCLMYNLTDKERPVHVVCSPKDNYLVIITAYVPTADKWENDFKTRRKNR
jgi:hypothetical protein